MSLLNIILALLVFSVIIVFHEFGHFIVAKYNKVKVIEFSLGMGPRIISTAKSKEGRKVLFFKSQNFFDEHKEYDANTVYSWKILPFGGSCMMLGEEEEVEDDSAFGKKSVLARMAIIFAGPFFNFILAFVLAVIVIGSIGYDPAKIVEVESGSPMAEAGVEPGAIIKKINNKKIVVNREVSYYTIFHPFSEQEVTMVLEQDGATKEIHVTPQKVTKEDGTTVYQLGFGYGAAREKVGVLGTLKYSAYEVKFWISTTLESLWQMISGKVSAKDISGPVGIVKTVGDVVDGSSSAGVGAVVINLLIISILLTANLGVMNLIPIPALDGGRLLFLIIEGIRRKPLPAKFENYVNTAGFLLLMGLMVVILVNDVWKIFGA
ncbi:MAG: site-2 protease family protein [Eubacterium sp.]|nr:site-2 protease family protein [Eubacterium sp.]